MKPIVHDQPAVAPPTFSHWPACPPPVRIPLTQLGGHPCPYLPRREACDRAFLADTLPPRLYHGLMDRGFRRSGKVIYQPTCRGCRACVPVRVRVDDFVPNKSHRRCLKRNADLSISETSLLPDEEKFELYQRYQRGRHGDTGHLDWQSFVDFLYDSPIDTREFCYRDADGRLVAVGICDVCSASVSSVYFYYDPAELRHHTAGRPSPGTALRVIGDDGAATAGPRRLQMRGPSLFGGYLDNPAATKAAFDDGWFDTGDLAWLREDGALVLTGRVKEIINRGGVKFNPADVEAVIDRLPGVSRSAVVPMPDPVLGEKACVFVEASVPITLGQVTAALDQAGIARYKWPERLEMVEQMPMTPTQKVMRGRLAAMLSQAREEGR